MKLIIFSLIFSVLLPRTLIVPTNYPNIQAGIDASVDGDTVLVQPGTYFENINFNGHNITLGSMFIMTGDTSYISQTIVNGNQNGSVFLFENGETLAAQLAGLTITNGIGTGVDLGTGFNVLYGGGIHIAQSNPTLKNLNIHSNTAEFGFGGGLAFIESNSHVTDLFIYDNQSIDGGGGGISLWDSSINMINSIIIGNYSRDGGGVYLTSSDIIVNNCSIITNNAEFYGGGIRCYTSEVNIMKSLIADNYSMFGSGFHFFASNIQLINCTIFNNQFTGQSGGIHLDSDVLLFIHNTLLWQNGLHEIFSQQTSFIPTLIISHSGISNGADGITTLGNLDLHWLENNSSDNPLFVNSAEGDYRLTESSPYIDVGIQDTTIFINNELGSQYIPSMAYNGCNIDIGYSEYAFITLEGDLNNDCSLDVLDITIYVLYILGEYEPTIDQISHSDLNNDEITNILDIVILVNLILEL